MDQWLVWLIVCVVAAAIGVVAVVLGRRFRRAQSVQQVSSRVQIKPGKGFFYYADGLPRGEWLPTIYGHLRLKDAQAGTVIVEYLSKDDWPLIQDRWVEVIVAYVNRDGREPRLYATRRAVRSSGVSSEMNPDGGRVSPLDSWLVVAWAQQAADLRE